MATGTVTITEQTHSMVKKVTFDWTATTGGADATTTEYYDGEVLRIVCMATTGATTGHSVVINDNDGVDLLGGQGTISTGEAHDFGTSTGGTHTGPHLSAVSSKLSLVISGGGSTGSTGQTIVYIR